MNNPTDTTSATSATSATYDLRHARALARKAALISIAMERSGLARVELAEAGDNLRATIAQQAGSTTTMSTTCWTLALDMWDDRLDLDLTLAERK